MPSRHPPAGTSRRQAPHGRQLDDKPAKSARGTGHQDRLPGGRAEQVQGLALAGGPRRYSDLCRVIAGVSQKMLTQTLRTLERDGLVSRTMTSAVPVRVDYALTPLGDSLMPAVTAIKTWAEGHIDEIKASRADYDGHTAAGPNP